MTESTEVKRQDNISNATELTELKTLIREATQQVEDELDLEDKGWLRMGANSAEIITEAARTEIVKASRLYSVKDPLAKQSIRLWTDYTFGTGMTWSCEDKKVSAILDAYWSNPMNQSIFSSRGQRRSSDKLLIDGECFFAIFLGKTSTIRLLDPLEITEVITDPDDRDNERYYKREWTDVQGTSHVDYYCSYLNPKDQGCKDAASKNIKATANAKNVVVYHLPYNTTGTRGMPLLTPAVDWIKQYRRFLASRIAVALALARFAWKGKVQGGASAVAVAKAALNDVEVPAGSVAMENMGVELSPITTNSNAKNAYDDGRMIKLQVAAAVGIPEQYFGDISIGNMATAKTVELPMMKMFQSYQEIWSDVFDEMDKIVLRYNGINTEKIEIDRDFPKIAPEDVIAVATALGQVIMAIPAMKDSREVMQVALMSLGINNTSDILDKIEAQNKEEDEKKGDEPEVPFPTTDGQGNPLTDEAIRYEATVWLGKNLRFIRNVLKGEKIHDH